MATKATVSRKVARFPSRSSLTYDFSDFFRKIIQRINPPMDWKVYFTKMATKINKIKSSMGQWRLSCRCQYNHWIERISSYYSLKKRSTTFVKSVFELSLFEAEYTPSHILNTPHIGQTISYRTVFILLFFILPISEEVRRYTDVATSSTLSFIPRSVHEITVPSSR